MKISVHNFAQLNDYLEKAEGKLRTRPDKELATREKIERFVSENLGLVSGADIQEVARFLQSVKRIEATGKGEGLVKTAIDAVANSAKHLNPKEIREFKGLDEALYYESLGVYISDQKKSIESLGLSSEELLKVAPWITYLDLRNSTLSYAFVDRLLEHAENLNTLILAHSGIDGAVLLLLNKLETLDIYHCDAFNQSIYGLEHLKKLTIHDCEVFNQSIHDLPNLVSLSIVNCPNFNHSVRDLPSIEALEIDCDAFEIQDMQTAYTLMQFTPEISDELIIAPNAYEQIVTDILQIFDEKVQTLQDMTYETWDYLCLLFKLDIPEEKLIEYRERIPLFSLFEMDNLVRRGKDPEKIKAIFTELRGKDDYSESLKIIVQRFPDLASFLIRNLKEEIVPELKSLNILEQLPPENKMALLPLFPPDQIFKFVHEIPEKTRAKWLERKVVFDQFSDSIIDVLKEIAEEILDEMDPQARDNLLVPLEDLFAAIAFHTLASLADADPDTLLAYTFLMDEAQMASSIPLIPEEAFVRHLKSQAVQIHREFLLFATTKQKEAYIAHDLFKEPESLTEWDQTMDRISKLMRRFKTEKTQENFEALNKAWKTVVHKTNLNAQTYQQSGEALQKMLLKLSTNKEHEKRMIDYFEPKLKRASEVLKSLKATGKRIAELENKVIGLVNIPEEYLDNITGELMTNPHHHPGTPGYIYDLSTWEMLSEHPATRAPFKLDELVADKDLKAKIDEFKLT
ncbi:MAG: U-box domain-containing protein [Parachlamydiaceae bacterium]